MPTAQVSTTPADHRIFGLTPDNQIRANLYDGPGCHTPGNRYSWVSAATPRLLGDKLERIWEQPLTTEELDAIEELGAAVEIPCEDCGGLGYDLGAIGPDPEPCPVCGGSGIEQPPSTPRRGLGIAISTPAESGVA